VPTAFGRHGLLFGAAFLVVQLMHITLYALAARDDPDLLSAVGRLARTAVPAALLIFVAGFVPSASRPYFWLAALIIGFGGGLIGGLGGWRLQPAHFVERHGLIIIIALGESLIAVGVGARATSLDAEALVAALRGLCRAASVWIAYFDFFTIRLEQLLAESRGAVRARLARDTFSYFHLPMIIGIVLSAFALREAVEHVARDLETVPALALCGGSALYLVSYVGVRLRISRPLRSGRLVFSIVFVALFPVALAVPAIVALALVAAAWIGLHVYEIVWWRAARAETRALRSPVESRG